MEQLAARLPPRRHARRRKADSLHGQIEQHHGHRSHAANGSCEAILLHHTIRGQAHRQGSQSRYTLHRNQLIVIVIISNQWRTHQATIVDIHPVITSFHLNRNELQPNFVACRDRRNGHRAAGVGRVRPTRTAVVVERALTGGDGSDTNGRHWVRLGLEGRRVDQARQY